MVTPSSDTSVSNGVYVPGGIANGDMKPSLSTTPLADFLMQLEDYTPTVCYIKSVHSNLIGLTCLLFIHVYGTPRKSRAEEQMPL